MDANLETTLRCAYFSCTYIGSCFSCSIDYDEKKLLGNYGLCYIVIYTCLFVQALLHASVAQNRKLVVDWISATDLEDSTLEEVMTELSGVLYMSVNFLVSFLPNLWWLIYCLQAPDAHKAAWALLKVTLLIWLELQFFF